MYRAAVAALLALGLVGCSHAPAVDGSGSAPATAAGPGSEGCALARWQAQTAPVINKRQGQEALDSDEADAADGNKPCP